MKIVLKSGTMVQVTAKRGYKPANWNPSGEHYRVTITANKKRASFDFWDSYQAMVNGDDVDLHGALSCFASDVMAGENASNVDDIADEFGYTKPSEALRVFNGVKRAEEQAKRLGLSWDDLAELADY